MLGRFAVAGPADVDRAVAAAREAQRGWARLPWRERLAILRRAAALIRERKYELAAIMSLEVGKSRLEAMGDAEESADLIDYYCAQVEEADGFVRPMGRITPVERNTDVLRPYGVFACIAPFNFPLALSAGMSSAALAAGNAVVYKPAEDTPWTGLRLYEVYRDAGIPAGVFNLIVGHREAIGDALWQHPGVDGVVFTGSKTVGMRIHAGLGAGWIKPCLLELGGKNAAIVMPSADLDAAAEGVMRSAFSLQNQKCSATSRVYVHHEVAAPFVERLLERTRAMRMGDPSERDVFFGPVINERAVARYERAVAQARAEGVVLHGGARLAGGVFDRGHFVAPTVALLPLESSLYREELFVPLARRGRGRGAWTRRSRRRTGSSTGSPRASSPAIPPRSSGSSTRSRPACATPTSARAPRRVRGRARRPFCGWKGSGSTGKGGCGPYYVAQFTREQSRTVIESARAQIGPDAAISERSSLTA